MDVAWTEEASAAFDAVSERVSILGTAGTPAVARRLAVEMRESGATLQQIADRLTDESA